MGHQWDTAFLCQELPPRRPVRECRSSQRAGRRERPWRAPTAPAAARRSPASRAAAHPDWRAFSFHFKPGLSRDARIERATRLLGLAPADLEELVERRGVLPSPTLGHEEVLREVDRLTAGTRLSLLGNWFAGLAIEDCVERSCSEWRRLQA